MFKVRGVGIVRDLVDVAAVTSSTGPLARTAAGSRANERGALRLIVSVG